MDRDISNLIPKGFLKMMRPYAKSWERFQSDLVIDIVDQLVKLYIKNESVRLNIMYDGAKCRIIRFDECNKPFTDSEICIGNINIENLVKKVNRCRSSNEELRETLYKKVFSEIELEYIKENFNMCGVFRVLSRMEYYYLIDRILYKYNKDKTEIMLRLILMKCCKRDILVSLEKSYDFIESVNEEKISYDKSKNNEVEDKQLIEPKIVNIPDLTNYINYVKVLLSERDQKIELLCEENRILKDKVRLVEELNKLK